MWAVAGVGPTSPEALMRSFLNLQCLQESFLFIGTEPDSELTAATSPTGWNRCSNGPSITTAGAAGWVAGSNLRWLWFSKLKGERERENTTSSCWFGLKSSSQKIKIPVWSLFMRRKIKCLNDEWHSEINNCVIQTKNNLFVPVHYCTLLFISYIFSEVNFISVLCFQ